MSDASNNAPTAKEVAPSSPAAASTAAENAPAESSAKEEGAAAAAATAAAESKEEPAAPAKEAPPGNDKKEQGAEKPSSEDKAKAKKESSSDKEPAADEKPDVEMTDATETKPEEKGESGQSDDAAALATAASAAAGADAPAAPTSAQEKPAKTAKPQRKSTGGGATESKGGKKLNRKQSKARILHLDAQPGDHFFVKLKGFPQWPVIICDEDMLPQSLLKSRPVTAKRADGTYREDYADGSRKVQDRTFPVMYLSTNEFGWVPNSDLIDLDPATVKDVKMDKMRKDLQAAHELAAKNHPLSYYKDLLQQFQEDLIEQERAKAAKAAATPKKKSKAVAADEEEEDVDMADAPEADEDAQLKEKKSKKRKAEENIETPQRSESVKKPKIKLTTGLTPKPANGTTSTPKPPKAATEPKSAKPKAKKSKDTEEKKIEKEPVTPKEKEPEFTPEEKHLRKEKEVLFLRHKLQKGLITKDQEPKEEEMKPMSDYLTKLECFPDLEVSIIRATKINKLLKAILKLDNIPKEEEFKFKPRSQVLLDKWNKLLTGEGEPANGVNGTEKAEAKANGVKAPGSEKPKGAAKESTKETAKDVKSPAKDSKEPPAPPADEKKDATEETKASEEVEAGA